MRQKEEEEDDEREKEEEKSGEKGVKRVDVRCSRMNERYNERRALTANGKLLLYDSSTRPVEPLRRTEERSKGSLFMRLDISVLSVWR